MEIRTRYIMRRSDGAPVNYKYEPVSSIVSAARFNDEEHFNSFITGYYKPKNPNDYWLQKIKVTYEEVNEDVQEE